jgi:hypothetical protein
MIGNSEGCRLASVSGKTMAITIKATSTIQDAAIC